MKTRQDRLKKAALAALFVITAAVVLFGHGKSHRPITNTAIAKPSEPAITTGHPSGQKTASLSSGRLKNRVVAFLSAYYRILPGDTAAVRRRRIRPFISQPLASRLKLAGSGFKTPSVQGQVLTGQLVFSQSKAKRVTVQVPVRIYVSRPGSSEKYITIDTVSVWTKYPDGWVADSFN